MSRVAIKAEMDASGIVREKTFENCEITGPATIVAVGTENAMIDCAYPLSADNTQMRIGAGPKDVVLVLACTFRRCTFATDVDASQLFALPT